MQIIILFHSPQKNTTSICSINKIINEVGCSSFSPRLLTFDENTTKVNNLNHKKLLRHQEKKGIRKNHKKENKIYFLISCIPTLTTYQVYQV